ncbi:pectinesterase family protein [Lewinella cohaerens]|uniref:pectinesterase family protein n=1 Tax=Lewinella cohaerens TaxID=70995 RepID=UPI0003757303|nr:pectinesterase family protein [Lewinella cohaerens]
MKRLIYLPLLLLVTVAHAQYKTEIYVAQDGSGDFTSIQAAIDDTKSFPDTRITIFIKDGIYEEKVKVHAWNNHLTLKGESPAGTIIRWGDYFDKIDRGRNSTFHTATLLVQGDDFRAENLTISNTAGEVGQAVALAIEADRSVIVNCRMLGHQDTLYVDGANTRQHFKDCYIEGTTDFIFGGATALFEDCIIHSKANSYITAASTPQGRPYGLVFLRCKLTAAKDVTSVYLGRPWRSYAQTVFLYCQIGDHIRPEGWNNWGSAEKEETVFYGEYGNTGPGAAMTQRVKWAHQLKRRQAKKYQPERVLQPFLLPEISN